MISNNNFVVRLLRAYHGASQSPLPAISLSDPETDYLYKRGLASVAIASCDLAELSDYARDVLRSADLTSRVVYEQICSATIDVLDNASQKGVPVVLIKGIWIAENLYPASHHRIMGDIDILVPEQEASDFQESLQRAGYSYGTSGLKPHTARAHHHLPPLHHPGTNVPVEVHSALFSHALLANEPLFRASTLWDHTESSEFIGALCRSFRVEFQFLYTIAHWAVDHKWATNVVSINDVILMLKATDRQIDWLLIETWLQENPRTADFLAVLFLFLNDLGLAEIPAQVAVRIAESTRDIGKTNMRILHWLMMRFPFSGRRQVGWILGRVEARVLWITLLEPRHKSLRLAVAIPRVILRRIRTMLGSTGRKIGLLAKHD